MELKFSSVCPNIDRLASLQSHLYGIEIENGCPCTGSSPTPIAPLWNWNKINKNEMEYKAGLQSHLYGIEICF